MNHYVHVWCITNTWCHLLLFISVAYLWVLHGEVIYLESCQIFVSDSTRIAGVFCFRHTAGIPGSCVEYTILYRWWASTNDRRGRYPTIVFSRITNSVADTCSAVLNKEKLVCNGAGPARFSSLLKHLKPHVYVYTYMYKYICLRCGLLSYLTLGVYMVYISLGCLVLWGVIVPSTRKSVLM